MIWPYPLTLQPHYSTDGCRALQEGYARNIVCLKVHVYVCCGTYRIEFKPSGRQ